MLTLEQIRELAHPSPSKIVLLVIDGLGGLPHQGTGLTELETARTPNLDALAARGICGLAVPVASGITPGSAPSHLALFGYDPLQFIVGRGVLEALGIDFDLEDTDVASRGNFCTVDEQGVVVDRRAGRLSTERCTELCRQLDEVELDGGEVLVEPVKEHRFVAVFRGQGLSGDVTDSDPQQAGLVPKSVVPLSPGAMKLARLANEFVMKAKALLASSYPANMVLLRGFAQHPNLPTMSEVYKLNAAAIAAYPMYRGLASLVGMLVLETGSTMEDELATLAEHYAEHDFFFVHFKETDLRGEDGDFAAKVQLLEQIDGLIPRLTVLNPDVLIVTGDHSTPALLKGHSWHPVPFLLCSQWCRRDGVESFGESSCAQGGLGLFPATDVLPLALAHALKLGKYGA